MADALGEFCVLAPRIDPDEFYRAVQRASRPETIDASNDPAVRWAWTVLGTVFVKEHRKQLNGRNRVAEAEATECGTWGYALGRFIFGTLGQPVRYTAAWKERKAVGQQLFVLSQQLDFQRAMHAMTGPAMTIVTELAGVADTELCRILSSADARHWRSVWMMHGILLAIAEEDGYQLRRHAVG